MRPILFRLLLLSTLAAAAAPAAAQGAFARLRGTIVDAHSQAPIVGARVIIAATGRYATSDSAGRFELRDIPSGVIRFFFAAEGYPRTSAVLAFARGETMVQAFELDSATVPAAEDSIARAARAQRLAPTQVVAEPSRGVRYEDFERRMRTGRGQYVTRQLIEERGYNTLSDAARTLRGVNVECGGPRGCVVKFARAGTNCYPQYIVDGRPDNVFGPYVAIRDIEGLEFYAGASDVPGEFAGVDAACGVVVIWTRSGPPPVRKP
ncbi:MAG: TonB-dependent receptor [Gemmatimonadaceae bacterium]|nr:TonB-dependent receptor [Gemmatimonadaceae bacterium]